MDHFAFVFAAYAVSGITLLGICAWVWIDSRGRQSELNELDASGIRRRSAAPETQP